MSEQKIKFLERALLREKLARKEDVKKLEEKSLKLHETNQNLVKVLGEKEVQLENLFNTILDPYILIDLYGNVLKMNSAAINFFGANPSKKPFNVVSTLHEKDKEYAWTSFSELVEKGSFRNFQAEISTKNRKLKWVDINASMVYDTNKKPVFAQGIIRDITDQKLQQQKFNEQKEQLNIIIDNSSLGIVLTQFGKILKVNNSFQELLGYSKDELLNKNVKDISTNKDYPASKDFMDQLYSGEIDYFTMKKRYVTKKKEVLWAKTSVSAVRDKDGDLKYQVAIVEDITKKIKIEKEKETLLNNLTKSNKELNDFAHVVSHDLKSPLRSMNALVTWLQEDCASFSNNEIEHNFQLLLKKIDKMDHLINGILKYASIDKIEHQTQSIDLNIIVNDILDTIFIPEHINVSIISKLPTIMGDKFKLHQLFQNIISNAVKYIDKEIGIVTVSCEEQDKNWAFSIEDNGKGIPKKYHKKIFEIFETLDDGKNSTGVGLSIVKKIIDIYNGKVWLSSIPGKKTIFNFTLSKNYGNP